MAAGDVPPARTGAQAVTRYLPASDSEAVGNGLGPRSTVREAGRRPISAQLVVTVNGSTRGYEPIQYLGVVRYGPEPSDAGSL